MSDRQLRVAFRPDGKTLVTATREGNVAIWDVASGVSTPLPAQGWAVAFSTNGHLLACTGKNEITLWDPLS